jgi:hypothetical protein
VIKLLTILAVDLACSAIMAARMVAGEEGDDPVCKLDGSNLVKIDTSATADPKGASKRPWSAKVKPCGTFGRRNLPRKDNARPLTGPDSRGWFDADASARAECGESV